MNKKPEVQSHLGIKVEAQPLCCHMGPSLLCVVTQDVAECKVQQVCSGMVHHAGQPLGLKAQTSWQGVLVLHSSGEQGMARRDKGKAACDGEGRRWRGKTMGSTAVR